MTQWDRDRLVVLKKAQKKLIGQGQAAGELGITARQVRRLLRRLKKDGDKAVIHQLRGRTSNRRTDEKVRGKALRILSQEVYRDFGPTLASEYLSSKHGIAIGREALRQMMIGAGLWRARHQKTTQDHPWRKRRSCRGELIQWDTSDHDWLEGRGERLYLIHMIDDATSELTARFVRSDSTGENMRLLWRYLERHGRPVAFYTDKASLFLTAPKVARDQRQISRDEREPLPPTQIGRALRELDIVWIGAHSPQAKGRVERSFGTAQDRLVKGLRVAGVKTVEQANRYLEEHYLPWWNQHLTVAPVNPTDAHRLLSAEYELAAALSRVETRQVANDYTIRLDGEIYQIDRTQIRPGLRGSNVRVESRLDGSVAVRFAGRYLLVKQCQGQPKAPIVKPVHAPQGKSSLKPSATSRAAMNDLFRKSGMPTWAAGQIDRTRTRDRLD
jgi:transposase InsO family protein